MHKNSTIVRIVNPLFRFLSALSPGLAARLLERLFLTPTRWKRPLRERGWMVGAEKDEIVFDSRRKLRLLSWGSGPVVLLVHGWAGRGSQMGALAKPLAEAGYRVVAFDAPAHGDSDGRMTGLPEVARAVELVAAHVGPLYAVVAHSLGSAATTLALSRGLTAQRVVYLAPPANPEDYLGRVARFLGFSEAVVSMTWTRIERRFGFRIKDARVTALARGMTAPLLVIHDEDDRDVPLEEGARVRDAWPGAAMITTRDLGHRLILRAPEVIELTVGILGIQRPRTWARLTAIQASA